MLYFSEFYSLKLLGIHRNTFRLQDNTKGLRSTFVLINFCHECIVKSCKVMYQFWYNFFSLWLVFGRDELTFLLTVLSHSSAQNTVVIRLDFSLTLVWFFANEPCNTTVILTIYGWNKCRNVWRTEPTPKLCQ